MNGLVASMSKDEQRRLRETSAGMYSKKTRSDGSVQVTGGKLLKSSGAYTPEFAKKVVTIFKQKQSVSRQVKGSNCCTFF